MSSVALKIAVSLFALTPLVNSLPSLDVSRGVQDPTPPQFVTVQLDGVTYINKVYAPLPHFPAFSLGIPFKGHRCFRSHSV